MQPSLKIVEGAVSPDDEHMKLSYGSFDTDKPPFPIVARVSPPRNGVITLELLVDDSTTAAMAKRYGHIGAEAQRAALDTLVEPRPAPRWSDASSF
jgi:hypothetical protein